MASITPVLIEVFLAVLLLVSLSSAEERKAIAVLKGEANGNVTFSQIDNGPVTVTGIVSGLKKGKHGFHIHEKGDISNGCISTQGHFNPENKKHGGPADEERHVGDLGNIYADDNGIAMIELKDSVISLTGKNCILGRGVVVHSDVDDLGRGGFADSLTTGHAGTRVACGVIGILHPTGYWNKESSSASTISVIPLLPYLLILTTYVITRSTVL